MLGREGGVGAGVDLVPKHGYDQVEAVWEVAIDGADASPGNWLLSARSGSKVDLGVNSRRIPANMRGSAGRAVTRRLGR